MIRKNNCIIKRLKKMAGENVEIINIDHSSSQTAELTFKCDASSNVEAAHKITKYFLGSGKADAAKLIDVSRIIFREMFNNDSEIKADGKYIFTDVEGLTLNKLCETMSASEIANIVTEDFYFVNMFGEGDYIEFNEKEGFWYLTV